MSKEEICDNTVNCLHSMDDEISCSRCPVNCECSGYTMTCHYNTYYPMGHIALKVSY